MKDKVRTRRFADENYASVYVGGKTYRFSLDGGELPEKLSYPEFLDVAINSWCAGGCSYCYVAAKLSGTHYPNVVEKIKTIFGSMELDHRPYSISLGGEGEPTAHPDFVEVLKAFRELDIIPNFTTNGMHVTDEVLEATVKYSGGVAVSLHPQLKPFWSSAIEKFGALNTKLNTHVVISNKKTINWMWKMFDKYRDVVDYMVILPYMSNREAPFQEVDLEHLEKTLDERMGDLEQVAFGANLYEFLLSVDNRYNASLYVPESVSGYLILDDEIKFRADSHGMQEVPEHNIHQHINEWRKNA